MRRSRELETKHKEEEVVDVRVQESNGLPNERGVSIEGGASEGLETILERPESQSRLQHSM